jgi:hypothetical protein
MDASPTAKLGTARPHWNDGKVLVFLVTHLFGLIEG